MNSVRLSQLLYQLDAAHARRPASSLDFAISGLIATTYSFLLLQCLVLCVFYPRLWSDASAFRPTARRELRSIAWRLRLFQFLAGLIPLIGAILLLSAGRRSSRLGSMPAFGCW